MDGRHWYHQPSESLDLSVLPGRDEQRAASAGKPRDGCTMCARERTVPAESPSWLAMSQLSKHTKLHKSEGGQLRRWAQDQLHDCRSRRDLRVVRRLQGFFNPGDEDGNTFPQHLTVFTITTD